MSEVPEDQATAYKYLKDADFAIEGGNITTGSMLLYRSIEHAKGLGTARRHRGAENRAAEAG